MLLFSMENYSLTISKVFWIHEHLQDKNNCHEDMHIKLVIIATKNIWRANSAYEKIIHCFVGGVLWILAKSGCDLKITSDLCIFKPR